VILVKVNINSIREFRGVSLKFQGQQEVAIADSALGITVVSPVEVQGTVTNTGEGFLVEAAFEFEYQANCGRCLEGFSRRQNVELKEEFIPGNTSATDDSVFHFSGDYINLQDCLVEQIYLFLPMKVICEPNCLGLCPECGKNLNTWKCQCSGEIVHPEFEKLRTLLSTKGGGSNG
jgi:uncharacterized protein